MLSKISKKLWFGKYCTIHQKFIFSWWCVCMFSFFCWSLQVSWWKLEEGPLAREMGKVIAWKDFCKNFPFFTFQLSFFVVQRFNRKFYPFTFSCSLLLVLKCNICENKIIFLNYSRVGQFHICEVKIFFLKYSRVGQFQICELIIFLLKYSRVGQFHICEAKIIWLASSIFVKLK